jgi:transposase
MYIEKVKNNGIDYLRLVESVYSPNKKGGRKEVILNIGPLSKYDDGKPDYVNRLRMSFKKGDPLIKMLKAYCDSPIKNDTYTFVTKRGDPLLIGHPKIYGHVIIERILQELGLTLLISQYKKLTDCSFDVLGFFRLMVYGRILSPASKDATNMQNESYYNPIIGPGFYKYNIYDTLDFVYKYRNSIINKMNSSMIKSFKRTTNCLYYDCTNFFFETETPDQDEDGIRKFGVSKENRHLPLVQMGLFIDEQGVPISIEVFPGNTLDHLTVINSLKNIDNLNYKRFVFVGDRGMYRGNNTAHLINRQNGYIMSKSIQKTQKEEREWIYHQDGYKYLSDGFKYKSRTIKRMVKLNKDVEQEVVEKVVVYWSRKFMERQLAENRSFLNFLSKLETEPTNFRITQLQAKSLNRFLKSDLSNIETGEIINSSKLKIHIDYEAVNKYRKSFGYYQIVTSEIDMPDIEVIDKYHGLAKIEEQFKIMKGSLEARPMYVRTSEHIYAHLLVCMISLTIVRIIQNKIVGFIGIDPKKNWQAGLSANKLKKALSDLSISLYSDNRYRFNNIDEPNVKLLLDSFGINIVPDLYNKTDLKVIKNKIKIF